MKKKGFGYQKQVLEPLWRLWERKGNKLEANCGDRIFNRLDTESH